MDGISNEELFSTLNDKGNLKKEIYQNTERAFELINQAARKISQISPMKDEHLRIEFNRISPFQSQLFFAGDALIFFMQTDMYEFSRDHDVMRTAYIRQDKTRSYVGIIHIYNFLTDSFKYNRENDLGYLIGRLFINKNMHYFIDGKREVGILYPQFGTLLFDETAAENLIKSSMLYTINFDLLTPPFDEVKVITAGAVIHYAENCRLVIGKRLGFRFQADND
ncbi:MAG TPA: hypothetical protein PK028_07205 [Bacteroidales bacterium]|jgi:hypothetical protein|nr:hypothetical protein [Bacteroidales bacterium]MDI9573757.1 hypothetical protein [Bacteroidota bacterium]OQC59455.1 MAG: hypothetical protein BWX51_01544 [Bacteroidetes bacterium ADurb.Bin012]MBP9512139.1 hypothetical protein [Bacteroidales bacterium]MBP9588932.1 hypothetical protein [Bacteroidales bacterium]